MLYFYLFAAIAIIFTIILLLTRKLLYFTVGTLLAGIFGLIVGLLAGVLISMPLSQLSGPLGEWLPLLTTTLVTVCFFYLFVSKKKDISEFGFRIIKKTAEMIMNIQKIKIPIIKPKEEEDKIGHGMLVDTSAIVDGRIENIAKSGFVLEKFIIPTFVLNELQTIADSEDILKRNRGRRGMEILDGLKKEKGLKIEIIEDDFEKIRGVDAKLIKLAKKIDAKILTVDYNLNKVAGIRGVKVLNINELTNALKTVLLPGERITVKVIQEGKESDQGVGYLEDGTMIVVEDGNKYMGQEVECQVKRIFQTGAGKMFFVEPIK